MQKAIGHWLQKEWRVWRIGALPGLAVIGLVILLRWMGSLQFLELIMLDNFLRLRPAEPVDERILIVGIDEDDIRNIGTYPIPDRKLVELLNKIQSYQPSVIGLDIIRDYAIPQGQTELSQAFQKAENWIAINRIRLSDKDVSATPAPAGIPLTKIGFVNALVDHDGFFRRSLLNATDVNGQNYMSLTAQLAIRYLEKRGFAIGNGTKDDINLKIGEIELDRVRSNTGGYVGVDEGESQILINFRSGQHPFKMVSMTDIKTGKVKAEEIRDRIVLVGITSEIYKDLVNSNAIAKDNPGLVNGVEAQAHAVSQIVSTVLDGRSLLNSLSDSWEYLWIFAWGMLGISLGRISQSPLRILGGLGITSAILIGVCYGGILIGWWLPVLPAFMALFLNGAGLTTALFYRYGQDLQMRLEERQLVINQTFDAIHSRPLQTLSRLLRTAQERNLSSDELLTELQQLDDELRSVWDAVRREALMQDNRLRLGAEVTLDLDAPLHEALYEVFHTTLQRDFPYFKTLKVQIPDLEPIDERFLTLAQKQMICRFVEEAMCNIGKHALGATSLKVVCRQSQGKNLIQVIDDGKGVVDSSKPTRLSQKEAMLARGGTRQAQELARQLKGRFQRVANTPTGTVCELEWTIQRSIGT